jgi:hypothetical protein
MDLKQQIEQALASFWDENSIPVADPIDATPKMVAALDSMSAVNVLIDIDEIVGMKVDANDVIRRGGYDTREQFVEDLTARVMAFVAKGHT